MITLPCCRCGTPQVRLGHFNGKRLPTCKKCRAQKGCGGGQFKVVTASCCQCGLPVECSNRKEETFKRLSSARAGTVYCSQSCRTERRRRIASETMARTNRLHASERMRLRNPMARPEIREKQKTTLRAMGWRPPVHGGNGRGPTAPQLLLASALGWKMEVIVTTGGGYRPTHYKLDVANETLKVAVEVDGQSHRCLKVQAADRRKDDFLGRCGWKVLRFSNRQVTEHLAECVAAVLSSISKLKEITTTSQKES